MKIKILITTDILIIVLSVLTLILSLCIVTGTYLNKSDKNKVNQTEKIKHSKLYIEGLDVENVILYFNEVCLDAENIIDGDPNKIQKWEQPIYYKLNGNFTKQDKETITNFTKWLNLLNGFPGIYETKDNTKVNLNIYFTNQNDLTNIMGNDYYGLDGAVRFWYTDDKIYKEIIGYRTDIDQETRNSVILEEIYNGLGPIQDTVLRKDSIIYSGFSTPQDLTEIDKLILKLLYHPNMKTGMTQSESELVIRRLYY